MNIAFLNPPNNKRIQRRYMCSYNAPSMLLPPQELIALAGIAKQFKECNLTLLDAIAEPYGLDETVKNLSSAKPDIIVSIQGFECFEEDMHALVHIKKQIPSAKLILFGHYATLFPEEILEKTNVDLIILGEPDNIFYALLDALVNGGDLAKVEGIAYRTEAGIVVQKGDERITHPELLPMPAYELLKADKYFEPFLKPPFGLIQSARGCPYSCNYCVRSFGKRLTYRTPDQIIEEIIFLKEKFGIRSLRFIDDTFTVHTKRVVELCQKMIDQKLDIEWTCLSRISTLKPEMVPIMKQAGCKRIYFGVESGSQKVLNYLNKPTDLTEAIATIALCKKYGIESLAFFIIGAPVEEEEDFYASVNFAIDADFDYIAVSELIPYPGTELFDALRDQVDFTLFPYKNEWKDASMKERNKAREKKFYQHFYYRRKYVLKNARNILRHPWEYIENVRKLSLYLLSQRQGKRADYM